MRNLEKGQHIFIAFQNGKAVLDSQLRPRMYTSLENADRWTPTVNKGKIEYVEYAPTFPQPSNEQTAEWVSVEERLPKNSECWETYIVIVNRSHWPTSSYDPCDAPYDETLVSTAKYDSKQKIWHLDWDEQLNALIDIENAPLNGDYVTHWMPLPAPPDRRPPEGDEET